MLRFAKVYRFKQATATTSGQQCPSSQNASLEMKPYTQDRVSLISNEFPYIGLSIKSPATAGALIVDEMFLRFSCWFFDVQ